MPELPEVAALVRFLEESVAGHVLTRVELGAISALKTFDPPLESLVGGTVTGCRRRGKYLLIDVAAASESAASGSRLVLAFHLARGGWIQWRESLAGGRAKPGRGPLALRVGLDDGRGFDVTEMGTEKRLAIWVVRAESDVEHIATLGPDPLDPPIGDVEFAALLHGHKGQIKGVLTDQRVIAGVGNAYSDDALNVAKLSPFRRADALSPDEIARLRSALVTVLTDAVTRSADLPAKGLKSEKRAGMRVHGRTGLPCPECGDVIREVSFATKSLQYCATCQTGGKPLADRRLSRLLK